jgi:hypothetical protein
MKREADAQAALLFTALHDLMAELGDPPAHDFDAS